MSQQPVKRPVFVDDEYQRSHMKAPRGRGSWAFQAYGPTGLEGEIRFFTGTLTEAKRQAAVAFAGVEFVAVLP